MIVHVKPAEGLIVRSPAGDIIPPAGMHLERDLYIQRRLRAGDLVEVEEPAPPPPPAEPTPARPPRGKETQQ